jgi:peptidoglycan hydrolase-like protein with peptidoglycan-binding domain
MTAKTYGACVLFVLTSACSGPDDSTPDPGTDAPLRDRLSAIQADLARGSEGAGVAAVQDYLERFGYFPNEALAASYARWMPIVPDAPAMRGQFDEQTELAVLALQRNLGLAQTGIVDEATRHLLVQPRCGFPDGVMAGDPANKWSVHGTKWGSNPTFRVINTGDTKVRTAAVNAFATWQRATSLVPTLVSTGTPDIQIGFGDAKATCGSDWAAGCAFFPPNGDIVLDGATNFSVAATTPSNALDLESVILHEAGHALGLEHTSSFGTFSPAITPVMFPIISGQKRELSADDAVAISVLYDKWQLDNGQAEDIATARNGDLWVLGPESAFGGWLAYKQYPSGIRDFGGTVGVRIAVEPDGTPWVLALDGGIFRKKSATSGTEWEKWPGCAKDIAIGATQNIFGPSEPVVWVLGCESGGKGGFQIWKWVPDPGAPSQPTLGQGTWKQSDGAGMRIAVDSSGTPLVVAASGTVWERRSADPNLNGWDQLPAIGAAATSNTDIYADPWDGVWLIGKDDKAFVLNRNTADPTVTTNARNGWVSLNSGTMHAIAAGPIYGGNLGPFVVAAATRNIYHSRQ